jgi:flavodoxin short chain
MSKVLIVYGSTTGNTEYAAGVIEKTLSESGYQVELMDAADIDARDMKGDYELVFLGSSTWNDRESEIQEDMRSIYETLEDSELDGKLVATFGCGDETYENFCAAVDLLSERAESLGASLLSDGLKIDGDPRNFEDEIVEWTEELLDRKDSDPLQTP